MITIDEDIKTASQLKRVLQDAVLEYAQNNHIAHINIELTPVVIRNEKFIDELQDIHINIDIKI